MNTTYSLFENNLTLSFFGRVVYKLHIRCDYTISSQISCLFNQTLNNTRHKLQSPKALM